MTWLLDSNGIIFRFFYGTGNGDGYLKLLEKIGNEKIIAIFDYCSNNFRKKILIDYKKHRVYNPHVGEEINRIYNYCINKNIEVLRHDEFEADDLIATYIHNNEHEEITIVSTDKDLCQLVNEKVQIYNPFKRVFLNELYIKDTFGVTAQQLALWQALCGDSSDNIPGIKGIGPKTATYIINNMKNIESIQTEFPKYDFSKLNIMLNLTTLRKDINIHKSINSL